MESDVPQLNEFMPRIVFVIVVVENTFDFSSKFDDCARAVHKIASAASEPVSQWASGSSWSWVRLLPNRTRLVMRINSACKTIVRDAQQLKIRVICIWKPIIARWSAEISCDRLWSNTVRPVTWLGSQRGWVYHESNLLPTPTTTADQSLSAGDGKCQGTSFHPSIQLPILPPIECRTVDDMLYVPYTIMS